MSSSITLVFNVIKNTITLPITGSATVNWGDGIINTSFTHIYNYLVSTSV